jgi:hypothetical protein
LPEHLPECQPEVAGGDQIRSVQAGAIAKPEALEPQELRDGQARILRPVRG